MFNEASNFVHGVDKAFAIIFGISIFFLVGITATMIVFVVKYRESKNPKPTQIKENPLVELTWIVIPLILVLVMFYYGYISFAVTRRVPKDAMVVTATGKMWSWEFDYGNGKISPDLVLPINKPVKLNLVSPDVVHSLFISAFRVKEDCVPGKANYMWFIPQMEGQFEILCTEYCGLRHSYMEAKAIVKTQDEYEKWFANLKVEKNEGKEGLTIMKANNCLGCHSMDGSKLVGPTLKKLFGSKRTVISGGSENQITADEAYIKKSILEPEADVVKGYPAAMRSYKGVIKDSDIKKIIDYLKSDK